MRVFPTLISRIRICVPLGFLVFTAVLSTPVYAHQPNKLLLDLPTQKVKALDFEAALPEGGTVNLSDYKGQVIFLNFWATWCTPCLKELPSMNRLKKSMAGNAFAILAVNMQETAAQVRAFAKTTPMNFPVLLDPEGRISGDYGVSGLPLTYVIDGQGNVIARALGAREWDSEESLHFFRHLAGDAPAKEPAAEPVKISKTGG